MITRIQQTWQPESWQSSLATACRDVDTLLDYLGLQRHELPELYRSTDFPLRVPLSFVRRMKHGDPDDPLLRQVLPLQLEQQQHTGYELDPVGDLDAGIQPGVLHKYHGRALLMLTGACAVHCRYCFRRHYPYQEMTLRQGETQTALSAIAADPTVEEIILSGGDPLMLDNDRLMALSSQLSRIPHVRRLRIHSRLPVVLPERLDRGFQDWLDRQTLQVVLVVHSNHPNEIDEQLTDCLRQLDRARLTVLNQTVLLKGVNDDSHVLARLSEALFKAGVMPYYLHLLDRVAGAAHFDIDEAEARSIFHQLQSLLPGYLVPRLVREIPGQTSKTLII